MARLRNKWFILTLLAASFFMVVLDVSVVNVALPSLAKDLHFAPNNLQWVITAYSVAFGGFLLLGGRTADVFGRRRLFITAVTLFSLASLTCGLSHSSVMLISARAAQGLMAAFMTPTALSIVLTEFEEGRERNVALGIWAAVASSGAAVGVVLGGVLTQYFGWRWNFFVNVPVGLTVVAFSALLLPRDEEKREVKFRELDHIGSGTVTFGLIALVFGLSKVPVDGWGSLTVILSLVLSVLLLSVFLINEVHARDPMMPLGLFKIRNVAGGDLTALIVAASLFSMFFFLTLYLQTILGYSPVRAGVSFLVMPIVIAIVSGITVQLVGRIGYKPTLVVGPLLLAVGLFMLSQMRVHGTYWHDVFPGLVVAGTGLGLSFVSLTLAATSGVPARSSGLVSGMLNTAQQIGGAIGLALLSVLANSATNSSLAAGDSRAQAKVHGYQHALQVGVVIALAASLTALTLIRNRRAPVGSAVRESPEDEQVEPAPA